MSTVLIDKTANTPKNGAEEGIHGYLRQIRQFPLLTPEEERELAKRCKEGDEEAIRTMVNSNLRLVASVAREYAGRGVPLLDLIQEGSVGLIVAAKKFDYTLENRFSTYATKWIRQSISRYFLNHAGMIRVPRHTAEMIHKLMEAYGALQQEQGFSPTTEEAARYCGISVKKAEEILRLIPEVCSLDAPAGADEDATLQMLLEDVQTPQPQETLIREELKRMLDELLGALTERQQQILRLYFGMDDGVCHTFEQIGGTLGISKERARQVYRQAMEKLQRLGADLGLEEFLK